MYGRYSIYIYIYMYICVWSDWCVLFEQRHVDDQEGARERGGGGRGLGSRMVWSDLCCVSDACIYGKYLNVCIYIYKNIEDI